MVGCVTYHLQARDYFYDFSLVRKFNYLIGNSGIGKTTLVKLIRNLKKSKQARSICILDDATSNGFIHAALESEFNLYVADEDFAYYNDNEFISWAKQADGHFLFITRTIPSHLPCSVDAIFTVNYDEILHTHYFSNVYKDLTTDKPRSVYVEDLG